MYVLQRNGDVFEMRQEPLMAEGVTRSGFLFNSYSGAPRANRRETWESFIRTGKIVDDSLPRPIAASWMRCRDLGVDPLLPKCAEFTPMSQINTQAEIYAELAAGVERQVYEQIKEKGLLMTVSEANGRLLRTCGNKDVLLQADQLYFGPGAVWSERSVGTNAISLALSDGMPAQVMGEEHFCSSHQAWGCSAAPIFTPFGQLWGCFDISGPTSADHRQALWLAVGAAREIERLLLNASLSSMENKSRTLLSTLFSSMPIGVLMVDESGIITYANAQAERLLGFSGDVRGGRAEAFFDYTLYARQQAEKGGQPEGVPLRCLTNSSLTACAMPFMTGRSEARYTLVTLQAGVEARPAPIAPVPHVPRREGTRPFGDIVYRSEKMSRTVEQARHMAKSPAAVLLLGETGTGKELFARAIHKASRCSDGPFVAVNCGALPRELIQSELFGYERGAFTGAVEKGRPGKFELADKGTLFLDEISEMPLEMQVNLLRPLEDRCVTRVGGKQSRMVDFRLVTATNRNLDELMASGAFREDLFYRIHVLALEIPPLRERREDIAVIAEYHCKRLCRTYGHPFGGFSAEALRVMEDYDWPGNVRQLVHSVEFAVNMAQGGCILPAHLPAHLQSCAGGTNAASGQPDGQAVAALPGMTDFNLDNQEAKVIRCALKHYNGNMLQAAKALGIGRNTLYAKLRKIDPEA